MANARVPGPIGLTGVVGSLDDGTMARALSPIPGSVGVSSAASASQLGATRSRPGRASGSVGLQILQQGDRGPEVRRLQRLLNARLRSVAMLNVDGDFGPITLQSVIQYQRGMSLSADGRVGRETWLHLLKGDEPRSVIVTSGAGAGPRGFAGPSGAAEGIGVRPLDQKLLMAVKRVPARLPERVRQEFSALLQLENLALSLAIVAGFCLLGGVAALAVGVAILGYDLTRSLVTAVQVAALATTERELDEAADELAHIVLAVGSAAFIKGIGRIAKGAGGGAPAARRPVEPAVPRPVGAAKPRMRSGHRAPPETPDITRIAKGQRPPPSSYLDESYIQSHLGKFNEGASLITKKSTLEKYGRDKIGLPDNTQFVMPKGQMDEVLVRANGDIAVVERELGIPKGAWQGEEMVRIDVPRPDGLNLRMPSGNEMGANEKWLPGGKLPTGYDEAVIDQVPRQSYVESPLWKK